MFTLTCLSPQCRIFVSASSFYNFEEEAKFLHGGCICMVRIQRRLSRKRYLGSKYVYEYERLSLDIPRKYNDMIKSFLKQDLDIDLSVKGSHLVITLTPVKTFLPAEYTQQKQSPESLANFEF
jgi:hypothetical protein